MPRLEDAIIPLPEPFGNLVVRDTLDGTPPTLPKTEEVLKQTVNDLKTRQFANSLPRLEYLQKQRPGEPDLLILRGCIYAESGKPEAAEKLFIKAIEIAPSHPWARLNLAEAQMAQKKYQEAEKTLTILRLTRPESEVVRFKLILSQVLQKKFTEAEQELQGMNPEATTPASFFAQAAIAFAKGQTAGGESAVDRAENLYKENQTGYFRTALAIYGWLPANPQ